VLNDPGRHHRRPAELVVRLAPYPQIAPGHPLAVSVRMDALHFFDERGARIDVGWR
jgi:multiple sugar transport system ATP-binding protein